MVKADEHSADVEAPTSTALGEQDFMQFHRRSSAALNGDKDGTCLCESSKGADFCSGESLYREADSTFSAFILASNKDSARKASEVFDKVLPTNQPEFDICQAVNSVSCRQNNMQIKEKLAMHKHFQRFKERVLTLKSRAFHHLWKEDMRLLSLRKYRAKPQKWFEPSGRSSHSGYQKHRSSIRSRFTSPGMNGKEIHGKCLTIVASQAMKRSIFGKGRASSPLSLASSSSMTAIEGEQDYPLRNARKNPTNYPPSQPKPSARRSSSSKSHHQKKQADANFLFSEETISKDTITTVMIKNILNKYSQKLLLNMLNNHCIHCNEQITEGEEEDCCLKLWDHSNQRSIFGLFFGLAC